MSLAFVGRLAQNPLWLECRSEQSLWFSIKALRVAALRALAILSTHTILLQIVYPVNRNYLLEIVYLLEVVSMCAAYSKTRLALEMLALWL